MPLWQGWANWGLTVRLPAYAVRIAYEEMNCVSGGFIDDRSSSLGEEGFCRILGTLLPGRLDLTNKLQ